MKKNNEKQEAFKRMYKEGRSIKGIARELKVTASTIRAWRNLHFPEPSKKRKLLRKRFKQLFLTKNKDKEEISRILGVSRFTVYNWINRDFPEIPNRRKLFLKIVNREKLTVNEIAFLLGIMRSSVLRFYKEAGIVPDELK